MESIKRSPLREAPLRQAGQSVEEEIQRTWLDDLMPPILAALFAVVLAGLEWWRLIANAAPEPWIFTAVGLVVIGCAVRRVSTAKRKLAALRQGRDGERIVGEFLEQMREKGYQVLHDIVGDGFNIDHLIIGPKGIFTIETKTISKPIRGNPTISYDGTKIRIDGHNIERDPVIQAKAQASWVKEIIQRLTGKSRFVRPVVVFPGWYVNPPAKRLKPEVWVLHPKMFRAYIEQEPKLLDEDEIRALTYHLSCYIRNNA